MKSFTNQTVDFIRMAASSFIFDDYYLAISSSLTVGRDAAIYAFTSTSAYRSYPRNTPKTPKRGRFVRREGWNYYPLLSFKRVSLAKLILSHRTPT